MKRLASRVGLALERELPFTEGKPSLHVHTSLYSVPTQMWWHRPLVLVFGKQRQVEFKESLGYHSETLSLKINQFLSELCESVPRKLRLELRSFK